MLQVYWIMYFIKVNVIGSSTTLGKSLNPSVPCSTTMLVDTQSILRTALGRLIDKGEGQTLPVICWLQIMCGYFLQPLPMGPLTFLRNNRCLLKPRFCDLCSYKTQRSCKKTPIKVQAVFLMTDRLSAQMNFFVLFCHYTCISDQTSQIYLYACQRHQSQNYRYKKKKNMVEKCLTFFPPEIQSLRTDHFIIIAVLNYNETSNTQNFFNPIILTFVRN